MIATMEVGLQNLLTVADAIDIIDAAPVLPRRERVDLIDADGRVLAGAIVADRDYPPFDKALMDGYAVRAADTASQAASGNVTLRRVGEVAAGAAGLPSVGPGECVAIMTGAPLPPGADAVVPVERTTADGDAIRVAVVKSGAAVAPRAVEAAAGRPLLHAGTRLGPAALAVCAQVGAAALDVFARPRVGILATGDEVIPYDATPTGAQIRGSNSILLAALVRRFGGEVVDLGHARDDPAAIAERLSTPGLDAVCVTGGMSMGAYDYTPRVMRELGYDLAVTKLKIKPGKPFVMAVNRRLAPPIIFGLPGNPVSVFVCTVRLVSRYLLRLGGATPEPAWTTATLGHALAANGPREFYLPAVVTQGVARVPTWNGSADLFAIAGANALLVRPADAPPLDAGAAVTLLPLPA